MAGTSTLKKPTTRRTNKPVSSKVKLGKVARVILYVSDFDRAVKFYTETLGIKKVYAEQGWCSLATEGTEIDLHHGRKASAGECEVNIGFQVKDLDATYAALLDAGVKVSKIFSPCGGLRCVSFRDPDGNSLGIEGK